MNRLSTEKRVLILKALVQGMGVRPTARTADVAVGTVVKLIRDAGAASALLHDTLVRNVPARRIECDELWTILYARQKNVAAAKAAPADAGDLWTWTALDSDTKLMIAWAVGDRSTDTAIFFLEDLRKRLSVRPQITTDGYPAYPEAVKAVFGNNVDYMQLAKVYDPTAAKKGRKVCVGSVPRRIAGSPDPRAASTSLVERMNLTLRMEMRRYTRRTNGHSKKIRDHLCMLSLYYLNYNFCRIHETLKTTPAVAAGLVKERCDLRWVIESADALVPPRRPARYRKREITP